MFRTNHKARMTTITLTHEEIAKLISDHVLDGEEPEMFVSVTDANGQEQLTDGRYSYSFAASDEWQDEIPETTEGGEDAPLDVVEKGNGKQDPKAHPQVSPRKGRR